MKKTIIFSLSCCFLIALKAQIPQENLVAHYPMDGDAMDITENQNHGVIFGSIKSASDRNGIEGNALFFDGESAYIDAESIEANNISQEITISVWIKPESINLSGFTTIVNKWMDTPGPGGVGYYLGINPDFSLLRWNTGSINADGEVIPTNEWSHIAVTYSEDSLRIYQNNVLTATAPYSDTIVNHELPLRIGYQTEVFPGNQFFHGSIDEILIYNRALSVDEIDQIFNTNTTNTTEVPQQAELLVYPNPFADNINIDFNSNSGAFGEEVKGSIIDVQGKLVKTFNVTERSNQVSTADLPSGNYFLILNRNGIIERQKLIKQ